MLGRVIGDAESASASSPAARGYSGANPYLPWNVCICGHAGDFASLISLGSRRQMIREFYCIHGGAR